MHIHVKSAILLLILFSVVGIAIFYIKSPKPITVRTALVERGQVDKTVTNTRAGTVKACKRARLAPVIGGQIAHLPIEEGQQVLKGTVLLELWNQDLIAQLKLVEQEYESSKATTQQVCITANVASKEAKRILQLREQQLASDETGERVIGEAQAKQAACQAAKASNQVSAARIQVAQENLERTILKAPFDGTIAEINGELGEVVTPSPIGVPTLPAVDLVDLSCLFILAPMDEIDSPSLELGTSASVILDAFPNKRFAGTVKHIAPYVLDIERQARTVDIKVEFEDPQSYKDLLPGYSADVEVILAVKENTIRIPTEAISAENHVFIVDPSTGILTQRSISVGISNWVYTEVLRGLEPGEEVVTSIQRKGIKPGIEIIVEQEGN